MRAEYVAEVGAVVVIVDERMPRYFRPREHGAQWLVFIDAAAVDEVTGDDHGGVKALSASMARFR